MWNVSSTFLNALLATPRFVLNGTYTPPGGVATALQTQSGTLTVDTSQNVRRQCSLTVKAGSPSYVQMMRPGTILHLDAGLQYGQTTEVVPVFHGEVTGGTQDIGSRTVTLSGGDYGVRLARNTFLTPYTAPSRALRTSVIAQVVQAAIPGMTVINHSTDTGTVGPGNTWSTGPLDVISTLTKDGGTEAFFLPDGTFLIRDAQILDSPPTWIVSRTLKSVQRVRPLDKLYNAVIVTPSATDGSQPWTQQVVQLNDTTSDLYRSKIGVSPYAYQSPTAASASQAQIAGRAILSKIIGKTTTLSLGSVSNPALEGGDVITVLAPAIDRDPADAFRHFIDSFTLDFASGAMTLATRSAQVSLA